MIGVYESDCCEHGYKWDQECLECSYLEYLVWGTLDANIHKAFDTVEEDRGER